MSARLLLATMLIIAAWPGGARGQNSLGDDGLIVNVPSPITSEGVSQIRNRINAARNNKSRKVVKVVFDFNPRGKEAALSDFGPSYELAKYIQRLTGLTTIAYVSAPVTGHAVLPVFACQEIVAGKDAKLGEILPPGSDPLTATEAASYEEILSGSRDQYKAVVKKMHDRGVNLGKGSKRGADFYVDLREPDEAKKDGVSITDTNPLPQYMSGQPGTLDAKALKDFGLVRVVVQSKDDLLDQVGISTTALRDDLLNGREPVAFRYVLRGEVDAGMRQSVVRVVKDVGKRDGNLLFLVLEVSGGSYEAAYDLAEELIKLREEPDPVMVVAVVPDRAPDTAAVIALGCSEIVLSRRKDAKDSEPTEAELGDFESLAGRAAKDRIDNLRDGLGKLASKAGYPPLLFEGMVDRNIGIVRVISKDKSRRKLMNLDDFEKEKADWIDDGLIKPKGQLLKLSATKALELGIARHVTDNREISETCAIYGVDPAKLKEATPGFIDRLAAFLRIPMVTVLLAVIGFAGLILELKMPGATIPGVIAALAFILLFWSQSQFTGQNAVLGGLIFLLGLVLVLIEVFVLPGFGVTGILGILFILGGIVLATFDKLPSNAGEWTEFGLRTGQYSLAFVGAMVLSIIIARFLPKIPYVNRLMLQPPTDSPDEPELPGAAEAASLIGAIGNSTTPLRPAGMAQFGERYIDVVSEGDFINAGARIQVVEVEGTRIVVKEV